MNFLINSIFCLLKYISSKYKIENFDFILKLVGLKKWLKINTDLKIVELLNNTFKKLNLFISFA